MNIIQSSPAIFIDITKLPYLPDEHVAQFDKVTVVLILHFDHAPRVQPPTYAFSIHLQQRVATDDGEWHRVSNVTDLWIIIVLIDLSRVDSNAILHDLIHHLYNICSVMYRCNLWVTSEVTAMTCLV